jgi:hypothetical protein
MNVGKELLTAKQMPSDQRLCIGFTGTREGMTWKQADSLRDCLQTLKADALHHGDCFGADMEAHLIAEALGIETVVHPPNQAIKRAWCRGTEVRNSKPYLDRNQAIVDSCTWLIAAPATDQEERRSGTWATIRYAQRVGKTVMLLERWTGDRRLLNEQVNA